MAEEFLKTTGRYEDWNVYQLSLIIVDITHYFVSNYLDKYRDRTVDQMVQAARSGKQNIVEGSCAAATSRETEIKLTNVAKASLKELLEDYKDYLRHAGLQLWDKNDYRTLQVRRFSKTHKDPADYLSRLKDRSVETVCNIAITLLHQLDYLLYCVIERAKKEFLAKGGIKEEMYRARIAARNSYQSNKSNQSNQSNHYQTNSYQSNQSNQSDYKNGLESSHSSHSSDNF